MYISRRWISCAAALLLCITNAYGQNDEIARITENIRSAPDVQTAHLRMAELVEIDSAAAATAFANELAQIEVSLDRGNDETLIPYLSPVFYFSDTADIRQSLVPTFERLLESSVLDSENLYLSAALARFGAQGRVQLLIDEYSRSNSEGRSARTLELLCKTNQDLAVRFVVEEVVRSIDPTQKLVTAHCLREMGNPASLEVMRRWDSIESGDFDLLVAKYYLQSIIQFGDSSDIEFIEWIESNVENHFLSEDFESEIGPLIDAARAKIDERAGAP